MKLKKGILLTTLTFIAISIMGAFSSTSAAITIQPTNRTLTLESTGYEALEKVIYRITDNSEPKAVFYCIKGGPGFGSGSEGMGSNGINPTTYVYRGTASSITGGFESKLPTGDNLKGLLWVLTQSYVPAQSTSDVDRANKDKEILLEAVEAFIDGDDDYEDMCEVSDQSHFPDEETYLNHKVTYHLEESDFTFVQQLAVWHFTNSDIYHVDSLPGFKVAGQPLSNSNLDVSRLHAMEALFDYLITVPSDYEYTEVNNVEKLVQFETLATEVTVTTSGDRKLIGPYKLKENASNINYSLEASVIDGTNTNITSQAKFVDASGNEKTLKQLVGTEFYISIPAEKDTSNFEFTVSGSYMDTKVHYWSEENLSNANAQPVAQVEKTEVHFQVEPELKFDLALRKFITKIESASGTNKSFNASSRVPNITAEELNKLANGTTKTVLKTHVKDALEVENGDIVTYTIRVYNEGDINGWATKVTDYLPEGLEFIDNQFNRDYGWSNPSNDGKTIVTEYLSVESKKLSAFDKTTKVLDYEDIEIQCKVVASETSGDISLKNIAEISEHKQEGGTVATTTDRDSVPANVMSNPSYTPQKPTQGIGEQDDDDYEELVLHGKYFDLSLRKFITSVVTANGTTKPLTSRVPSVVTSGLLTGNTTAIYNHTKDPVGVSNGDIVTYTIRVYNEGQLNGYVTQITDHIPPQLEYIVDDEINAKYGWKISADGRTVTTDITSPTTTHVANRNTIYGEGADKVLLNKFDGGTTLDYIDVQIRCRVKDNIELSEKITNIAEITGFTDEDGNAITDRDSQAGPTTGLVVLPSDATLPEYKGHADNKEDLSDANYFYKGQQDDDDFEKLIVERFDLALRKFITGVKNNETSEVTAINSRVPVFKVVDGKYTYEHPKDPVEVANGNIVIYTLRIFNEGNVSGYASEVKDDLPSGLEFLPNDSTNTAFGWKMYKEDGTETSNVAEAKYIKTDFLSKENEKTEGNNLIEAFDTEEMTMPDYKDLKIAFKVTEPNTSDRIIINSAQIANDTDEDGNPVDDIDSIPNEWNEGEDDQDIEKIKVKYFDLSLRKWVTESIVTLNGKTTITKSNHKAEDDPEAPMKVEIRTSNINKTTVKFKYSIRVKNEGEIAGYATEIIDYVPEGLKFEQKDNPKWKVVDGKVVTDQLKDTLLQPGETAEVEIILTWINGKDNMGQKDNWAEINKDDNEYGSPDIDSTPGNNVKGEDDIDVAPVLLSPSTGSTPTYITLVLTSASILAGGVFLIKKFVI